MLDVVDKYKKGKRISIGKNRAIIVSDVFEFKEFNAIYADITENIDFSLPCGTYKIHEKVALIIRDMKKLLEMRINSRRKKSYILSRIRALF